MAKKFKKTQSKRNKTPMAYTPAKPTEEQTIELPVSKAKEILNDLKPEANIGMLKKKYKTPQEFVATFKNGFTIHILVSCDTNITEENPVILIAELRSKNTRLNVSSKVHSLYKDWELEHNGTIYKAHIKLVKD